MHIFEYKGFRGCKCKRGPDIYNPASGKFSKSTHYTDNLLDTRHVTG